jgi:hypothetical protein
VTPDPTDPAPTPAPPARPPARCYAGSDAGHWYARATDGTRIWVCRGCGRRVPFHTDGET